MKVCVQLLLTAHFMLVMLCSNTMLAQVPQLFNYQGIARDVRGNPLSNRKMSLKLSVLPASDATIAEYEETQIVTTNEFGLYTLQIGNGTAVSGEMKNVKWETGNKYIKVAIDPNGGTNYADAGTNQLLSVPYAIYADKSGVAANGGTPDKTRTGAVNSNAAHVAGDVNYLTKFTALNTIGKSILFDNGTNIGIGTAAPVARFQINQNVAAVQEHVRMQNLSGTGAGRFTLYNDLAASYATFTKYGNAYAGAYAGITTKYPYANLMAFGNNGPVAGDGKGRFLISSAGNIGVSLAKGGTSKLKFHIDFITENVSIGGNTDPVSRIHMNNTDGTSMTTRLTNNTTGHTAADGLEINNVGNAASIMNKENSTLMFGTNNAARVTIAANGYVGIGTTAPADDALHIKRSYSSIKLEDSNDNAILYIVAPDPTSLTTGGIGTSTNHELPFFTNNIERLVMKADGKIGINTNTPTKHLDVNGQVRIRGGFPAYGKILTADDTTGTASWKYPVHLAHYIGELYGGGIVFNVWRDAFGNEHGLIASLEELGIYKWGDTSVYVSGAVSKWNGAANTTAIVLSGAAFVDAAVVCDLYNGGGYSDWYLPASEELKVLSNNLFTLNRVLETDNNNNSLPVAGPYWSSTQSIDVDFPDDPYWTDEDFAYVIGIDYALTDWYMQGGPVKKSISSLFKTRAVRSF